MRSNQIKNNQPIDIDEFNTRFEKSFMNNYVSGSDYEKEAQAMLAKYIDDYNVVLIDKDSQGVNELKSKYNKIDCLFKRDEQSKKVTREYRNEMFRYLKNNKWIFTEKVDGTNIRIHWD